LVAQVSKELFHAIDAAYSFSSTKNAEIRFRWFTLGIKLQFEEVYPLAIKLLTEQGRMKFVRPLFRDLYKSGGEKGKQLALETFAEHRSSYHAICQKMVAKDLNVE
jgi:leukotriene-A4 hydrolase